MPDQPWNSALCINRHEFCHQVPQGSTKHPQGTFLQQIHENSYNLMAHTNNGNLFSCCGPASGGNYCHSPANHSCRPMQGMQSSGKSQRAETWTRTQHSRSHWDQVTAGPSPHPKTEMVSYSPKKLYPPLGHCAIDVYRACPEKAAVLQLFIHFLLYSRRGKFQLSKMSFQNLYTGKNCAVATQELNKHHTVTPMDGLHFSFSSQHRKTYFSSSWLFNPSFCSKWIRLGFNQFLFGPNSFRHTGKFNIEQNTEVKRSNNTSKELFPLCQQHSAADPFKYERLNEEG